MMGDDDDGVVEGMVYLRETESEREREQQERERCLRLIATVERLGSFVRAERRGGEEVPGTTLGMYIIIQLGLN